MAEDPRTISFVKGNERISLNNLIELPLYQANEFSRIKKLGSGSNSQAYLIKHRKTGKNCVCKYPIADHHKGYLREGFGQKYVECKYILGIHGFVNLNGKELLLMEYAKEKSLKHLMDEKKDIPESELKKYVAEIIVALEHMHSMGVYHGDLTYDNIYIINNHVQLADFGDCQAIGLGFMTSCERRRTKREGKKNIMSKAELIDYRSMLALRDWVYIGRLIYSLFYGEFKQAGATVKTTADNFFKGRSPSLSLKFPSEEKGSPVIRKLIQKFFSDDVLEFLVPSAIEKEEWFSDINWNELRV